MNAEDKETLDDHELRGRAKRIAPRSEATESERDEKAFLLFRPPHYATSLPLSQPPSSYPTQNPNRSNAPC